MTSVVTPAPAAPYHPTSGLPTTSSTDWTPRCSWRQGRARARHGRWSTASCALRHHRHRRHRRAGGHHLHREGAAAEPAWTARPAARRRGGPGHRRGRRRASDPVPGRPRRPRRRGHRHPARLRPAHPGRAPARPASSRIEVLDEVGSAVAFDDRWAGFVDQLLADPGVERPLLLATAAGVRLDHLRLIALSFNENWDLARAYAPAEPVEVRDWSADLAALLDDVHDACAERDRCDDDDRLLGQLDRFETWTRQVEAASDEYTRSACSGGARRGDPRAQGELAHLRARRAEGAGESVPASGRAAEQRDRLRGGRPARRRVAALHPRRRRRAAPLRRAGVPRPSRAGTRHAA